MLSVIELKNLNCSVYQQLRLGWKPSNGTYSRNCYLNLWVGACCGFNVLSTMNDICSLDEGEFDKFMKELSRVFKQKDYGTLFDRLGTRPPYPVNQMFFLYGDTASQRITYAPLIKRGKEVHRYRSGSEPDHDTVMISIDL
jgi:hypothetical protein